jgi:transposase, IS5 family
LRPISIAPDSSLLGDGTRVLTRLMNKVTTIAGVAGTKVRDRMRSVGRRVMEIAGAARVKGEKGKEKLRQSTESCWTSRGE